MTGLFDQTLRAARRDRAAAVGPELFLLERAFADCLERLAMMERRFDRALLIGCPDRHWPARLQEFAGAVDVVDPGARFASAASGRTRLQDPAAPATYDLVVAIGTLDTDDDLPVALRSIHQTMRADGLVIGAMSGGDTLPQLRTAMRAADQASGVASAHVHPRIEASALAPLLEIAGFVAPVVDVDRVMVRYPSLMKLVDDLRRMAATNILDARSRQPLSRSAYFAAVEAFIAAGDGERTTETLEILHFAARSK